MVLKPASFRLAGCVNSNHTVVPAQWIQCSVVVWTKSNPTPWNTIKPDEGTKLMEVNQKFEKRWVCKKPNLLYL